MFLARHSSHALCRQQQQQCRECYKQLVAMRHDVLYCSQFYWTLGSVIEDRAATCQLLSIVRVIDATGTAGAAVLLLLLCFALPLLF